MKFFNAVFLSGACKTSGVSPRMKGCTKRSGGAGSPQAKVPRYHGRKPVVTFIARILFATLISDMFRRSRANKKRAWKMERASVGGGKKGRARSNKFSGSDADKRPRVHSRKGHWVG